MKQCLIFKIFQTSFMGINKHGKIYNNWIHLNIALQWIIMRLGEFKRWKVCDIMIQFLRTVFNTINVIINVPTFYLIFTLVIIHTVFTVIVHHYSNWKFSKTIQIQHNFFSHRTEGTSPKIRFFSAEIAKNLIPLPLPFNN